MTAMAGLLVMCIASASTLAPTPWRSMSVEQRANTMRGWQTEPLSERLLAASSRFLDVPYVFSPLGEGKGKDPDPTLRFDAADCLSLVEESISIALAPGPSQIEPLLSRVRYGPSVSYEGRNHLMEAQWLPHAVSLGLLRDVTREYGGEATVEAKTVLTEATWKSPSSKTLALPPDRRAIGEYSFPLIPLEAALAHVKRVPSGTVLVVVREPRPFKVTRMTHLGFVVQKGSTFLRHASKSRHQRVVDEDLSEFFARNAKYDKWPVSGIALYEVLEPGTLIQEASQSAPHPRPLVPPPPETEPPATPLPQ